MPIVVASERASVNTLLRCAGPASATRQQSALLEEQFVAFGVRLVSQKCTRSFTKMPAFGTVSTVIPPTLKKFTQPGVIQFGTEYTVYKEQIAEVNRSLDASRRVTPASIRNCINPDPVAEPLHPRQD